MAGGAAGLASQVLRRPFPLCREVARTLLHGHRFDGSLAERALGLRYRPLEETVARTLAWYEAEGLIGDAASGRASGRASG